MNLVTAAGYAQALPPIATIVAALITGFGAAVLKRRWDVDTDRTRWDRDRAVQLRLDRLDAFTTYLSVRPRLAGVQEAGRVNRGHYDLDRMAGEATLAATRLIILLDHPDEAVIEDDLRSVLAWLGHVSTLLPDFHRVAEIGMPAAVVDLAKRLAR